jgi:hypothetical protein
MSADDSERQRRLAEALRANLRRRRAQVRARGPGTDRDGESLPGRADGEPSGSGA